MKVKELIEALGKSDPEGRVYINIDTDEWPALCITTENRRASRPYSLRICRSNKEVLISETVLHDDMEDENVN